MSDRGGQHAPGSPPLRIDPEWEVAPHEAKSMLDDPAQAVVLIDCRTPEEHELVRIEGALLAPLGELSSRIEGLREHESSTVIVYCHHGRRSLQATAVLRRAGFENVRSLAGGIDLWSRTIDPGLPRY